ncbi:hypothetical protein ACHHYP_05593 [Achlya hypogyna]|uniref:Uncharacterized protein n=1 Tax=Achlya hypogyna TaxID=1202772 RepID=A0A1V9YWZ8_ACHHY|nr:hypothetical protein ACHHYP_05593 [Achlya hypogyna]
MYTGALGRVNALEFRSPAKVPPSLAVVAPATVTPAPKDVLQRALSKVKEVALTSPECASYSEADLLACLSIPSPTAKPQTQRTRSSSGGTVDDEISLLSSFATLDLATVAASRSPSRTPTHSNSFLHKIPEGVNEDYSPRLSVPDDEYVDVEEVLSPTRDLSILSAKEAHRLLRGGGSIASRVRQRQQPTIAELEQAKTARVVEKINRQSIVRRTTLRRTSNRVSFADLPPAPASATQPPPARATVVLKKPRTARASTVVSHTRKVLLRHEKQSSKPVLDAAKRVSNMKLGTSPKKCKVKHEDLTMASRRNCRPRRRPRRLGDEIIKETATYVSLEVVDRIGTRAACPVHLLTEQPTVDFSHVPGIVDSHNTPRRKSVRFKRVKRPSLWIATHCTP